MTFTIDSTPDRLAPNSDSAAARLFTGYTGVVTVAGGRGRLDVVTVAPAAPASVAGLRVTGPSAGPGDYYLFDSTGVTLVRPRQRAYARLAFTDYGVGGPEDRTGWPSAMWEITPIRVTAAGSAAGSAAAREAPLREVAIFWHLDLNQRTPAFREVARGRLRVAALPLGEVGVVRWLGPAQALGRLSDLGAALTATQIGITAVAPVQTPSDGAAVNFVMQRSLSGLRAVDVDLARLVLPAGYREVPWPVARAMRIGMRTWHRGAPLPNAGSQAAP